MKDEFNEMDENFIDEDFDDGSEVEMVSSILKAAAKSANKLTALIVDNNRHNDVKMSNEDIYDIYRNSFVVAITTIAPANVENQ